ncbi:hypothetical protein C0995_004910 [Termitomyces sp. Mi166|nr:hypothetical protein C0995_004910 [Termitomyces sp. Mi166\
MSPVQHERSVVLPSIHEMFPEHLLKDTRHISSPGPHRQDSTSSQRMEVDSPDPSPSPTTLRRHTTATAYPPHAVIPRLHTGSVLKDERPFSSRQHVRRDGGPHSHSPFSFDVLRSDPSSSSLQHLTSSPTFPNRGGTSTSFAHHPQGEMLFKVSLSAPDHDAVMRGVGQIRPPRSRSDDEYVTPRGYSAGVISFPAGPPMSSRPVRSRSPDDPDAASDGDLSPSHSGKKHVCSTCFKRFNRPSSLRIHDNTHTGATPFRCPWPNCAREFNVNSNMRRHYRNHTAPGVPRPQALDNRRRRKRGSPSNLVFVPGDTHSETHPTSSFIHPPIVSQSVEHDSDVSDDEEDELDSSPDEVSPVYMTSQQSWERPNRCKEKDPCASRTPSSLYSQSHMRSGQTKSSSSSSPSPSLGTYTYSPSAPYSRSFADSKVSTALRPAFHSKPVSAPVPGEPMSI